LAILAIHHSAIAGHGESCQKRLANRAGLPHVTSLFVCCQLTNWCYPDSHRPITLTNQAKIESFPEALSIMAAKIEIRLIQAPPTVIRVHFRLPSG
jgi:hypothetical protein